MKILTPEVRKILSELLAHRKTLVVVAITGLLMAAAETRYVMSLKDLVEGFESKDRSQVVASMLMILGLALVKGVARYFHLFEMNWISEQVAQTFRQKLQSQFMRFSLSFHNNFATGSGGLISRILNDIVVIQHGLRMFADLFREPVTLFALIVWLFYLDWQLTCFVILVLPLVLLFLRTLSKGIKKHSLKGQIDLESVSSTIKETIDGVRIIQSFNLQSEMERRFHADSHEFLNSRRRTHRLVEMSGPVTEFIMTALILGIVAYMVQQVAPGGKTIGTYASYGVALLVLGTPVRKLQEAYVRIQEVIVAATRTYALLDSQEIVPIAPQPKPFPKDWKTIEYKNVSLTLSGRQVLKNVSLTIKRGEVIAFVGESGSGKSSLVNLLERFFDPSSGEILIDGIPLKAFDLQGLRQNVALVSQDVFLFSDTIERNIWAGDFSKDPKLVIPAAQKAFAHDFIMKKSDGYQTRVGDRGNLLSGGEKQRVSIARAFLKDAPILILDEATSALDTVSEIEVQRGLESLMAGRTVFVIAHRLSSIAKAHRIFVLKDGQILESGSHAELVERQGEYSRLYR